MFGGSLVESKVICVLAGNALNQCLAKARIRGIPALVMEWLMKQLAMSTLSTPARQCPKLEISAAVKPTEAPMSSPLPSTSGGSNPLECQACRHEMRHPVRLPTCQHCFCRECVESEEACPVCQTPISDGTLSVEVDRVLSYVIDSSREVTEPCGNCDSTSVDPPMYYCETCQQPLCAQCQSTTHTAKIFNTHHIVLLEERGKPRGRIICASHNEPFILFSFDAKKLMCIECFNNASLERRGNFVNIDLAHRLCCEKLEKGVQRMRLQKEDLDERAIDAKKKLTDTAEHQSQIDAMLEEECEKIVEQVRNIKEKFVEESRSASTALRQQLDSELARIESLSEPLRLNLLSASVLCTSASKMDLLHCYAELAKAIHASVAGIAASREMSIAAHTLPTKMTELDKSLLAGELVEQLCREHQLKTARCSLPPLLSESPIISEGDSDGSQRPLTAFSMIENGATTPLLALEEGAECPGDPQNPPSGALEAIHGSSSFPIHAMFESPLKAFLAQLLYLSRHLLQTQRDITQRRCAVDRQELLKLVGDCGQFRDQLLAHKAFVQQRWQQECLRMQRQQRTVKEKFEELGCLERLAERAWFTATQLRPYANYMSGLMACGSVDTSQPDQQLTPMEQICLEITSIEPHHQQRLEAIEEGERMRKEVKEREMVEKRDSEEAVVARRELKRTSRPRAEQRHRASPLVVMEADNRERRSVGTPVMWRKRPVGSSSTQNKRQHRLSEGGGGHEPSQGQGALAMVVARKSSDVAWSFDHEKSTTSSTATPITSQASTTTTNPPSIDEDDAPLAIVSAALGGVSGSSLPPYQTSQASMTTTNPPSIDDDDAPPLAVVAPMGGVSLSTPVTAASSPVPPPPPPPPPVTPVMSMSPANANGEGGPMPTPLAVLPISLVSKVMVGSGAAMNADEAQQKARAELMEAIRQRVKRVKAIDECERAKTESDE